MIRPQRPLPAALPRPQPGNKPRDSAATPGQPARHAPAESGADATLDATLLAAALAVLLLSAILTPRGNTQLLLPVLGWPLPEICFTRRWLGIACPGCGLTRSLVAMMHGQVRSAWQFNPAGLAVFAAVAFQLPYRTWHLWRRLRGSAAPRPVWLNWSWAVIGTALVIQWLARF